MDVTGRNNHSGITRSKNYKRVRRWFSEHLCGTQRECSKALGLSTQAVNRHVKVIRAEWEGEQAFGSPEGDDLV